MTQPQGSETQRWKEKFTKIGAKYLAITNSTPYYRRAIYAAKVLILMLRAPATISIDQRQQQVFLLIEEVEFVINYVTIYGFATFGTDNTGKMHKALAKAIDAMEVVLRKSDSDTHKQAAASVKGKAESLKTQLIIAELTELAPEVD